MTLVLISYYSGRGGWHGQNTVVMTLTWCEHDIAAHGPLNDVLPTHTTDTDAIKSGCVQPAESKLHLTCTEACQQDDTAMKAVPASMCLALCKGVAGCATPATSKLPHPQLVAHWLYAITAWSQTRTSQKTLTLECGSPPQAPPDVIALEPAAHLQGVAVAAVVAACVWVA